MGAYSRAQELEETLTAAQAHAAEEVLRSERAVLVARDDVGRRNAETANKLARVLALEKELEGVREEARVRLAGGGGRECLGRYCRLAETETGKGVRVVCPGPTRKSNYHHQKGGGATWKTRGWAWGKG